jgi:hypothetical protein
MLPLNQDGSKTALYDHRYDEKISGLKFSSLSRHEFSCLQNHQNFQRCIIDTTMSIFATRQNLSSSSAIKSAFLCSDAMGKLLLEEFDQVPFPTDSSTMFLPFQDQQTLRWMVVIIDLISKRIHFFNIFSNNTRINSYFQIALKWLGCQFKRSNEEFNPDQWRKQTYEDPASHSDNIDSGPYIILCINFISLKLPYITFESHLMDSFRKIIATSILSNSFRSTVSGFETAHDTVVAANSLLQMTGSF